MIKKINIAGVQLDNYTVREMIMNVEKMLSDNVFECIQEVDMDTLSFAETDEQVREVLDSLDYTIISDTGILKAAGVETMQHEHEIKDKDFFYELLKRIERNHKTVFVLGSNESNVDSIASIIDEEYSKIKIVGKVALETVNNVDSIVNDINTETPDVIISVMPSPEREHFLYENRDKLSANLWYGMGANNFKKNNKRVFNVIKRRIKIIRLAKNINEYKEQEVK